MATDGPFKSHHPGGLFETTTSYGGRTEFAANPAALSDADITPLARRGHDTQQRAACDAQKRIKGHAQRILHVLANSLAPMSIAELFSAMASDPKGPKKETSLNAAVVKLRDELKLIRKAGRKPGGCGSLVDTYELTRGELPG